MGDRWAVVRDGVVETVIAWSGVAKSPETPWGLRLDPTAEYVELADGVACGPGWTRAGDGWTPPAPPVPTVEEAVVAVNAAIDEQIARGWKWRGTRWSASERAQLRWSRLDARADALAAAGALPIDASNIDDTVFEPLTTAAEIREAAAIAEAWVVGWVGRVGGAAKQIVTAQPGALPAVLAALAADTPQAAGSALAALAKG